MEKDKYAQDGVNVVEGDSFKEFAGKLCQATYGYSPYVEVRDFSRGHFRGPRGFRLKGLPEGCWMDIAPDGDGTKVVLVDAAGDYENAARGWVAMVCGDVTRWGGIPLVLVDNLDTSSIGKTGDPVNQAFRTMMVSLQRVAHEQNVVMFKGETAELPGLITFRNKGARAKYLWSGIALGAYNPITIITGDDLKEGMPVMALRDGFRNNGISSVRKALAMRFGVKYFSNPEAQEAIRQAVKPAVLYDDFLATVNGWYSEDFQPIIPMKLIVHVTGGAIESKLAKDILFPRGLSAKLDNLWEPPEIMRQCARWRGMSDRECYKTWNGGQGNLVVLADDSYVDNFCALAKDRGIQAKLAGRITKKASPVVTIESKFNGDIIKFTP